MRTNILIVSFLVSLCAFSQNATLLPQYEGMTEVSYSEELVATDDANADSYIFEVTTADGNFSQLVSSFDNTFSLDETNLPGLLNRTMEVRVKTVDNGVEGSFGSTTTFQTEGTTIEYCGPESDAYEGNSNDPFWEEFKEWREEVIQSKISEVEAYRADITDCEVAYRIPVVFHVVYDPSFPETNVPNDVLLEQIDILNQEFNGPNTNSLGGNACIEFCLAQNTPSGEDWLADFNSDLPGITRWSDAAASDHGDISNTPELMSLAYFPPESYLNIYITRHVDNDYLGITGYATFPGGAGEFDGVVQEYWSMSDYMPIPGYDQGFILVHEIGHYLSLYHTFQSNSCQIYSPGCETDGDMCCDTPPAIGPNGDVCIDNTPNSCGVPEQLENYMDYSLEDCKSTFTENQIQRMHATLLSLRQSLVTNVNHINTGIAGPNGCISADLTAYFDCSASQFCLNSTVGEFTGIQAVDEWTISFSNPNGAIPSISGSGTIPSATVTFPVIGEWIVTLTVENIVTEPLGFLSESKSVFVCECLPIDDLTQANWYFGEFCSIDFNSGMAVPGAASQIETPFETGSISNAAGDLLFYTDGEWIWNANHALMNPLDPLNGNLNGLVGVQPTMIVPDPGNSNRYYVFIVPGRDGSGVQSAQELQYSIVDMALNSGLGGLALINQPILPGEPYASQHLSVIPHCNGVDYWIVTHGYSSGFEDRLIAYLLTPSGIDPNPVTSESFLIDPFSPLGGVASLYNVRGRINSSKEGELIAISSQGTTSGFLSELFLYCFDKSSGEFDLLTTIDDTFILNGMAFSFSESGNFLFTTDHYGIYQFDVRELSGCNSTPPYKYFPFPERRFVNSMQLGPDGKVYFAGRTIQSSESDWLSVINFPEEWSNSANSIGINLNAINIEISGDGINQHIVNGLPNMIDAQPQTPSIVDFIWCSNDCENVTFKMTGCGADIEWDVLCDGTIDGTETTLDFAFSDPGIYCVSLTVDGQTVTHDIEIQIPETPIIEPDVACLNQATIYSSPNSTGLDHLWEITGSGTIVGDDDLPSVEVWWTGPGEITLTITDELGCSNSTTISVSPVDHNAQASVDAEICVGESIQLESLLPSASCNWVPTTDLDDPNSCSPIFTPSAAGVYQFVLSSISTDGCVANDDVTITVVDDCCPTLQMTVTPDFADIDINTYPGAPRTYTVSVTNPGSTTITGAQLSVTDFYDLPQVYGTIQIDLEGDGIFDQDIAGVVPYIFPDIPAGQTMILGMTFYVTEFPPTYLYHDFTLTWDSDPGCDDEVITDRKTRIMNGCPTAWSNAVVDCSEEGTFQSCFLTHNNFPDDTQDGIEHVVFSFMFDPGYIDYEDFNLNLPAGVNTAFPPSVTTTTTSSVAPSGSFYEEVEIVVELASPGQLGYYTTGNSSQVSVVGNYYMCIDYSIADGVDPLPTNSTVIYNTGHLATIVDNGGTDQNNNGFGETYTAQPGTDPAVILFTDDFSGNCLGTITPPSADFTISEDLCDGAQITLAASATEDVYNTWEIIQTVGGDFTEYQYGYDQVTIGLPDLPGTYEITHYVYDFDTDNASVQIQTHICDGVTTEVSEYSTTGGAISSDTNFGQNIVVTSTGELTISNSTLLFAEDAGVIVEPGGRLTIENSTLDALPCAGEWYGIDIQGNRDYNQFSNDGLVYQGVLDMDNSYVYRAQLGVTNYDRNEPWFDAPSAGGKLDVDDSYFIDCRTAVSMAPYKNMYNGTRYREYSSFKNCDFTWTENFQYADWYGLNPMMYLNGIKDLRVEACDFENQHTGLFTTYNWQPQRSAVWTSNGASIDLRGECTTQYYPCGDYTPSTVKGFKYGLVLHGGRSSVRNTDFNNYRSIYNLHNKGARFTSNTFGPLVPELQAVADEYQTPEVWAGVEYGLYLDKSGAYWVEDNDFDKADGSNKMLGLVIRGSGGYSNLVYDNDFLNNDYGTVSYDDNRGLDGTQGLKYECNHFTDNTYGLSVTSIDQAQAGWGISHTQGVAGFSQFITGTSAGNIFDAAEVADAYDMRNEFDTEWVTYYAHPSDGITEVQGAVEPVTLFIDVHPPCISRVNDGHVVKKTMADLEHAAALELKVQLDAMIDGGDTDELLSEVVLAQYADALELYYELMAKSPNLSLEVMLEAIQKETELPAVLLTSILESNPHAAKSKEVENELDERSMPLDEYQRYMIDQGKYLLSNKEKIESAYSQHLSNYEMWMDQAITLVLEDDAITDKIAYIQTMIQGKESLAQRYLLIDLHLEAEEFTAAQSLLSSIASDFDLGERKDQEYVDYQTCYTILINNKGLHKGDLTPSEHGTLLTIAYKHANRAAGLAQLMLMQYADEVFVEGLMDPALQEKSRRNFDPRKPKFSTDPSLHVYPNPTDDHLILEFKNWEGPCDLTLFDAKGSIAMQQTLESSRSAQVVNTSALTPGTYELRLISRSDPDLNESLRIEISR